MFCMCVIGLEVMGWDGLITRLGQLSSTNQDSGWYDRKQRALPSIITSVHITDDIILLQTITHTTPSEYFLFKNSFNNCILILLLQQNTVVHDLVFIVKSYLESLASLLTK